MDLKPVSINEKEQIFLDGKLLDNVESYRLEHSAGSEEPAELTVTMYVRVSQVGSELQMTNVLNENNKMKKVVKKRMTDKDMEKRIYMIAEAVTGLNHCEWSRIKTAVDKKFSSASARVKLDDTEELKRAIQVEF